MIIIVSFKEVIISGAFEKMAEASDKEEVFTNFMKEVRARRVESGQMYWHC